MFMIYPLLIGILLSFLLIFKGRRKLQLDKIGLTKPNLSIVIPARNEESNLGKLLTSLKSCDYQNLEIIVANDNSDDGTKSVAESYGAKCIDVPPLPKGWKGKTWACQNGAESASGSLLLFLDADVVICKNGLKQILNTFISSEAKIMSIGPYHRTQKIYESLSSIFNLLTFISIGSFGIFGSARNYNGFFGPCLLVEKETYTKIGGHDSVKSEILENWSFGVKAKELNIPALVISGKEAIDYRMYPDGYEALRDGWSKAFVKGMQSVDKWIMICVVAWMSVGIMIFSHLILGIVGVGSLEYAFFFYLVYALSYHRMVSMVGKFRLTASLFYPIILFHFYFILLRSSIMKRRGESILWKGRGVNEC